MNASIPLGDESRTHNPASRETSDNLLRFETDFDKVSRFCTGLSSSGIGRAYPGTTLFVAGLTRLSLSQAHEANNLKLIPGKHGIIAIDIKRIIC
mmetsp:Transcript_14186/g.29809  ORF Transcript_14186/g.29809 Transcript_14186/m.29809 type:complete len:95 (-) Transcript_14186:302-586(-)